MDISQQKTSAIVIILGSVLFLIAAFLPISRVFPEPSAAHKLEMIMASPTAWVIAQLFFALGAIVTVIGIAMVANHVREQSFTWLIGVSMAILAIGAALWIWHLYVRTVDPEAFARGALPFWPVLLYFGLTELGLAVFGAALLRSSLPSWVGWLVIGSMVLFFVLPVIFRDIPSFVFYLITLVIGVLLYR